MDKFLNDAADDLAPRDLKLIVDFETGASTYTGNQMEISDIKYRRKSIKSASSHEIDLSKHRKERKRNNNSNSLF